MTQKKVRPSLESFRNLLTLEKFCEWLSLVHRTALVSFPTLHIDFSTIDTLINFCIIPDFFPHIFIVVSFALLHHLFILQIIFGAFSLSLSILRSFVLRNWPTLSSFDFLTLVFLFTMPYPEALVAGVSGRLKYFQLESLKLRSQYIEYDTVKVTYLQCCS